MESIPIKVQAFEGPMDLLLHLIDINKINITDIPIVEITDQYLDYLERMQKDDMNVTSEFIVMAATLLDIKCRMLLPKEVNEEGEEVDPRDELVEKLLEYKMCKYMSLALKDREMEASKNVYRGKRLPPEVRAYEAPVDYEELIGDNTLDTLGTIFREICRRANNRVDPVRSRFGTIEKEEVDMGTTARQVQRRLLNHRKANFRELLEKAGNRDEIIVTFLVVLEMIKLGAVEARQESNFGEIYLEVQDAGRLENLDMGEAMQEESAGGVI
ncbi:MAG: segregation/condensation protein A [Lachnospiraceae bacterium]|nr:segregation/condensation protein A [Lachnospiraceae bacterium]